MARLSILPGGSSISFPPPSLSHARGKRSTVKGWTSASTLRLTKFLWSVDTPSLTGTAFAVTLTVGTTPDTSVEWATARGVFLQWLRDRGATRFTWLTEWTRLGRPHLHLCVYVENLPPEELALAWCFIARNHGWAAELKGQSVETIWNTEGWLKYVAKHSARGVDHYQRTTPPAGWETTGRLWGRCRNWVTHEPVKIELPAGEAWRYIGLFRDYQATRMISEGVDPEVVSRYLYESGRDIFDHPVGVSGWIPFEESARLLAITKGLEVPQIERR